MARTMLNNTMDVENYKDIQRRPTSFNKSNSKSFFVSSIVSSILYHQKIEINNDLLDDDIIEPINSSQLLYDNNNRVSNPVSKAVDNRIGKNKQYVSNKSLVIKNMPKPQGKNTNSNMDNVDQKDNIINIQILYDPNKPTESDLWNGNFHPILLHGSLEQLLSDSKNIIDSLYYIAKYIKNKKIDIAKSNNIEDLKDMGEAAWNFVSSIYSLGWDSLIADNRGNSFR